MTLKEIFSEVSRSNDISERIVERAYRAFWRAIREHIVSLPLKQDLTDEEFLELQPNVNIPSIGKLYITLDRYKRIRKLFKTLEENKQAEPKQ